MKKFKFRRDISRFDHFNLIVLISPTIFRVRDEPLAWTCLRHLYTMPAFFLLCEGRIALKSQFLANANLVRQLKRIHC